MKLIFSIIIITVAHQLCAQQFNFSPVVGYNIDFCKYYLPEKDFNIPDYSIVDVQRNWFLPEKTIAFGARFEYKHHDHNFNVGVMFNDKASCSLTYGFFSLVDGMELRVDKTLKESVRLTKFPLNYTYTRFSNKKNNLEFQFLFGCTILLREKLESPFMQIDDEVVTLTEGDAYGYNLRMTSFLVSNSSLAQKRLFFYSEFRF